MRVLGRASGLAMCLFALGGSLAGTSERAWALPAGWAYELVSPPDTLGTDVTTLASSRDGDDAWMLAQIPISSDQGSGNIVSFAARRSANGWTLQDLSSPGVNRATLEVRSTDGERALISKCDNILLGCLSGRFGFELVEAGGRRTALLDVPHQFPNREPSVLGASDDLALIVFRNYPEAAPLLPGDTHTSGSGLYGLRGTMLEYLGVDEHGDVLPCGAALGNDQAATNLGSGNGFQQSGISADGKTIAYESPDDQSGCPDPVDVYIRRDGASVNISRPAAGPDEGARFAGASRDGNTIYIETRNQLVPEDTDASLDVYRYDVVTQQYSVITGELGSEPTFVSVSPHGDYVYFGSPSSRAGQGVDGNFNLYVYHAGEVRFVATSPSVMLFGLSIHGDHASYITPDGTHFLFTSSVALRPGQVTGNQTQIFQYDFVQDELTCISCATDATAVTGPSFLKPFTLAANQDVWHQSDDGGSVAFESGDALVTEDVNNRADVYLWREDRPLALVSSGQSPVDSYFQGMSSDGKTVFLLSADRLLPGLGQDNLKAFVAREGGGFLPSIATPRCADDACQGLLTPSLKFEVPISETLEKQGKAPERGKSTIVTIGKIGPAARERAADTGKVAVRFHANAGGRVVIGLAVRLGGRWMRTDREARMLSRAGRVRLKLEVSARGRAYLARSGAMRVRVTVTHGAVVARRVALLRT